MAQAAKYLLCYDICDPKRLRRVHREVRDWGNPVQYSVFELEITPQQLNSLIKILNDLIDTTTDKVRLYRLTPEHQPVCLGADQSSEDFLFV